MGKPPSPMKTLFVRLSVLALCALIALPVPRLTAADTKDTPSKFQLSWTRIPPPELKFVLEKIKLAENRLRQGVGTNEELIGLRGDLENIENRTGYLFTIQSAGGTLREFIAAASIGGSEVSFTLINAGEPIDLETPLPPFSLRNVSWATVVEVLANFLATRGLQLKHTGLGNSDQAKSVICVLRRDRGFAEPNAPAQSEFDSFQLTEQINDTQTVDVIVDAIRTAWTLDPARDPKALLIKFHPGTKMLFVTGPGPATTIARQVIGGLRKNPVSR